MCYNSIIIPFILVGSFACDVCEATFMKRSQLIVHCAKHTKGKLELMLSSY